MRGQFFCAIAIIFSAAVVASAQPPPVVWQRPTDGVPQSPPAVAYGPGDAGGESFWIRGEYVVWTATTQRGLQAGQELSGNPLANSLLELTGTSQTDLISAAFQNRIGYRLTLGKWFDPEQTIGFEATGFYFYRQSVNVPLTSADAARGLGPEAAAIGLPALTGGGGGTVAVPINSPLVNGLVNFELDNLLIYGVEVLGRCCLYDFGHARLDGLLGVRRLEVEGTLGINAAAVGQGAPVLAGAIVSTNESIFAESVYSGPVIGLDYTAFWGPLDCSIRPKVQIAYLSTTVTRQVSAQANIPGVGMAAVSGGTFLPFPGLETQTSNGWAVIPELELRLGCCLTSHIRLVAGASFMMIPDVSRTEGQLLFGLPVDRLLPDVGGIPAGRLVSPPKETLFVITGSVGIEFRF